MNNSPKTQPALTPVIFNWSKWDKSPHWVHQTYFLGEDEFGFWFGQIPGSLSHRPGSSFITETHTLMMVSHTGDWVAKFFPENRKDGLLIYVDLAHSVAWDPAKRQVTGIDMDLDVIKTRRRGTWIEDIDEFEDRKVSMQYPEDVIETVWNNSLEIEQFVNQGAHIFDGRAAEWFRYFISSHVTDESLIEG